MEVFHLALCSYMMGLCWLVQRVHYPSFLHLTDEQGKQHAFSHVAPTKWITAPPMIAELASAIYLVYSYQNLFWGFNLLAVLVIWASTFGLQVPAHNRLAQNWEEKTIRSLINTNWIRTILWSARTITLLYFILL